MDFQAYDTIEATFMPQRLDTLRPESRPFIGQRLLWRAAWLISEEDGGPYVGQWAFDPTDHRIPLGWVPEEDLSEIIFIQTD